MGSTDGGLTLVEMSMIFVVPWGWPFLAYVALQVLVPVLARGTRLFWASLLPVFSSIPILAFTYYLGRQGSNLWPLFLILGGVLLAACQGILLGIVLFATGPRARGKERGSTLP